MEDPESLPAEVVTRILLSLPYEDILKACVTSKRLAEFCRDPNFWADKAFIEFGIPRNMFIANLTTRYSTWIPRKRYRFLEKEYWEDVENKLQEAVRENNLRAVKKIIEALLRRKPVMQWPHTFSSALANSKELVRDYMLKIAIENPDVIPNAIEYVVETG